MLSYILKKSPPLCGEVPIQRSKNAILPALAAALLTSDPITIHEIPHLSDIENMLSLLSSLGVTISRKQDSVTLTASSLSAPAFSPDKADCLRASVLLMGSLLARCGEARLLLPGGCAIGSRPIDQHIKGFCALGVRFSVENDTLLARRDRLIGAYVRLDSPSVGATENLLLLSATASGTTTIENAAKEPEVEDLITLLHKMGAKIEGAGTSRLTVHGVPALHGATHTPIFDRIAAGTFAMMTLATCGDVTLRGAQEVRLAYAFHVLSTIGAELTPTNSGLRVRGRLSCPVTLSTAPYPGFPTDLQPLLSALLTQTPGTSTVTERVFENRFRCLPELDKMGASVFSKDGTAKITGRTPLHGANVTATDLRAGAALLLAGLCAEGETVVSGARHILRGYESIERTLSALGASVELRDL